MLRTLSVVCLTLTISGALSAADFQGLIVDWKCVKPLVQHGREKTFKNNRSCSLMKNYQRSAYGLITDDNKFYRLDDPGNQRVLQLLRDQPDKDNLRVVVSGELQGDAIKVTNISML
jgi:hypothetical protein